MVDEAKYQVLASYEDVEVRRYPRILLASVDGKNANEAFGLLFRYISGKNESSDKIAMTVPVITDGPRGKTIEMTAPVIRQERRMSFVMPSGLSLKDLPRPLDDEVRIDEIPERVLAVTRFRGYARDKEVRERTRSLLEVATRQGLKVIGEPFEMLYNSPWTPGFMRRNEVAVEMEWTGS
jgi:effector-binding domain-containing protein